MLVIAVAIVVMVLATIAVAGLVLAPRLAPQRLVFDLHPDAPHPFGYAMAWIAIRTRDTPHVLEALGLQEIEAANWRTGLGAVYSPGLGASRVFVSPPVNGWTFVVGLALPQPLGKSFADKTLPLIQGLGRRFIEVQYYLACPEIDHFAWARIIDGRLVRAFAIGDEGILWNKGKPSKEERAMGLRLFELRGVRGRRGDAGGELILYPTEHHVMRLAEKWSLDPTRIGAARGAPALGAIGRAPTAWLAERLRRAA